MRRDDNSNWMSRVRGSDWRTLATLVIPGSHDSFSYSLDSKLPVAPDQSGWVQSVAKVVPFFVKPIVKNWGITQGLDCRRQLEAGVRYFDIRLAKLIRNGTSEIRVVHGLYGCELASVLASIRLFLQSYSKEVVVLHFNHYYDMAFPEDFDQVAKICFENLSQVGICLPGKTMPTLGELWAEEKQIFLVGSQFEPTLFWRSSWITNPWANTVNIDFLDKFLSRNLQERRDQRRLLVSQAILTPDASYIAGHIFSSLWSSLAKECNKNIRNVWLKDVQREGMKPNIVMVDFAHHLSSIIVQCNDLEPEEDLALI